MVCENGYDPEPKSDYATISKEFDINWDIYGNIYGKTSDEKANYLISSNYGF